MDNRVEVQVHTEGRRVVVNVKTPPAPAKAKERRVLVTSADVLQELRGRGLDVLPDHIEGHTLNNEISQRGTWVFLLREPVAPPKPKPQTKARETTTARRRRTANTANKEG